MRAKGSVAMAVKRTIIDPKKNKEDNHLLIFCVFSSGCSSNISQKYKLGKF